MGANRLDRRSVPSVGYIVRSYPRLSQTFILDEIRALERLGVPIHIFAMTDPREEVTQAEVAEVRAPVQYLDRLGRTWASAISTHLRAAIRWGAPMPKGPAIFQILKRHRHQFGRHAVGIVGGLRSP